MKAVIDTNIIIDYLNGIKKAKKELENYSRLLISPITWMEVLVGAKNDDEKNILKVYLEKYELISIDATISEKAVMIRRTRKIRLPDAIIQATAEVQECILVTRNVKDFPKSLPFVKAPYKI